MSYLVKFKARAVSTIALSGLTCVLFCSGCLDPQALYDDLEQGQRPREAKVKLKKILDRDRQQLRAGLWLVRLNVDDGELKVAEEFQAQLAKAAPGSYHALSGHCSILLAQKKWNRAKGVCDAALKASEQGPRDLNQAAAALVKNGQSKAAVPLLEKARELAPNDASILINLAYCHLMKREFPQATLLLKKALALDPDSPAAHKSLARAYFELGLFPDAIKELEQVLALVPNDFDALNNLALIHAQQLQDHDRAGEYLQRATEAGMDMIMLRNLKQALEEAQIPADQMPSALP